MCKSCKLSFSHISLKLGNLLLCAFVLFVESGGRKLNENKALTSKKARFDPYGKNKFAICRICKSSVHQPGSHYCQGCAYKKELAFLGCLWMHKLQWRLDPLVPDYQSVIPALDKDRAALLHTFLTSILDHGTFSQQNKGNPS
uniref:Cysteine-rich PDZ-binding protein n=1 Tax=Anser brachyrhynchus TaxID=132585 RepID=A0A8B9BBX9_9AVES